MHTGLKLFIVSTYSTFASRNNYLNTLEYGNDDSVKYTCDNQGRVTKQTYEDCDTVTYTYGRYRAAATCFDAHGIDYTGYYSVDRLVANISEGSVIVVTVFCPTGWHTMTALYTGGKYLVFNQYNDSSNYESYSSLDDVISNGVWIYGIRINENEKN